MTMSSLAVFCGSKTGNNPVYVEHARQLGLLLATRGITLIYGGGNKGIMGAIADAVLSAKGKVTGIIPHILTEWEHQHEGVTDLIVVEDMHARKKLLYEKCDAAIILPGGFGTMDELFEMLTWNQLSIHNKKIYILNSAGYYDHLIAHARRMEEEKFLYDHIETKFIILSSPDELLSYL